MSADMNEKELKEAEAGIEELATVSLTGDLEEEFRAVATRAREKIDARLAKIYELHKECEDIAEKTGIPFQTKMFSMEQQWTPKTFHKRWSFNRYSDDDPNVISYNTFDEFDIVLSAADGFAAEGSWSQSSIYC